MKKLFMILALGSYVFATDYSNMSIEELSNLRGSVPVEDRDSFRSAFQEKMKSLPVDERSQYSKGKGQGLRDGSGSGNMYKGSRGNGNGRK